MAHRRKIPRAFRHCAMIGIAAGVDDAPADGDISVAQDEPPGRRHRRKIVDRDQLMRTQGHAGDFSGRDRARQFRRQRCYIDAVANRLNAHRGASCSQLHRQLAARNQRRCRKPEDFGVEYRRQLWRVLAMTRHVAALDDQRPVENDRSIVAGLDLIGRGAGPRQQFGDLGGASRGRKHQLVAYGQAPRIEAAREHAPLTVTIDVLYRHAQRQRMFGRRRRQRFERIDQRRAAIPAGHRAAFAQVGAVSCRHRNDRARLDADFMQRDGDFV